MVRPKSVILSKEEKKNIVTGLKAKLKEANDAVKALGVSKKAADTALATATKTHAAFIKKHEKDVAAATKNVDSVKAQLDAMTAPAA